MAHHCRCCPPFLSSGSFGDFLYAFDNCYFDYAMSMNYVLIVPGLIVHVFPSVLEVPAATCPMMSLYCLPLSAEMISVTVMTSSVLMWSLHGFSSWLCVPCEASPPEF